MVIDLSGPPHSLNPHDVEYVLDFPLVLLLYAHTRQWKREEQADRLEETLMQGEAMAQVTGFTTERRVQGYKSWHENLRREIKSLRSPEGSVPIRRMTPEHALVMYGQTQVEAMKASGEYADRVMEPEPEAEAKHGW